MALSRILSLLLLIISLSVYSQDVSIDRKLGEENAVLVEMQMGIYQSPELRQYVQNIVDRLVGQLGDQPFDYHAELIDQAEPNAFALPAGHVYVTRGLLAIVNTEGQLAGILSHEIIHAHRRHSIKQMTKRKPIIKGILELPGRFIGLFAAGLGELLLLPVEAGSVVIQATYSRNHEKEADELGVLLMAKAGYNPAELGDVLESLSREIERLTGKEEKQRIWDSHPITPKRLTYLESAVEEIDWTSVNTVSENFLIELEGLIFGLNPNQGITRETEFLHPDLDLYIKFGEKWKIQNTPESVAAYNQTQDAVLSMTIETSDKSLDELAENMIDTLQRYSDVDIYQHGKIDINGLMGYQITLVGQQRKGNVFMDLVYVEKGGLIYQFMGVSYPQYRGEVLEAVMSLRGLTEEERTSIYSFQIAIEKAKAKESLSAINERANSHWDADFGAIANGMETNTELKEDQQIKVLAKTPYVNQ